MKTTIYSRDKTINRREWWNLSHLANQTREWLCELSKTGGRPQRAYCFAAIGLGFLRYVEWVKAQGMQALLPTLKSDWHGKSSGAHSKFFGRNKREVLGIESSKKVLYSLRH